MSVADTYAEALFDSAREKHVVAAVRDDLAGFVSALAESDDLAAVLANPEIETRAKKAAVAKLADGASPLVGNFLQVLLDRGRIDAVADIRRAFETRVAAAEGRIDVHATTAVPLDDALRQRLIAKIEADTGMTADLTERVDPEIVGGLVLSVGGVVLDASVREKLAAMRRRLAAAPIDSAVASAAA